MPQNKGIRFFRDYKHLARLFHSGAVFVAFDTETTGLHAESDHLLEIGAVKFTCHGIIGEAFDELIKPPVPVPPFIVQLTHIDECMVAQKRAAEHVIPDFLRYVGSKQTILLAHNAPFDAGFINKALERMRFPPLSNLVIDTLPLARWAYPKLGKEKEPGQYKLQSLAKRLCIDVHAAHRADDDARVCKDLFTRIIADTMSVQKGITPLCDTSAPQPELFIGQNL